MAAKKKKKKGTTAKRKASKKRKKPAKRQSKKLQALMAAFSGESRHDDAYVAPAAKPKRLSKKQRAELARAAMAAYSGESRHSDFLAAAAPSAPAKRKKLTAKERKALAQVAMAAYSGESRHGPQAEFEKNMRLLAIAEGARRHQLSNPRRRKRRKTAGLSASTLRLVRQIEARRRAKPKKRNPIHFPKDPRGRPAKKAYWILDVYKGGNKTTYIGAKPVDKTNAKLMAMQKLTRANADKVALSGPYRNKPTKLTLRK
jgi:hypothetical protein